MTPRRYSKKSYKKKATRVTNAKSVMSIARTAAKQELNKVVESKSQLETWTTLFDDNLVTSVNPFYLLSQGTTSETIIGEKIFVKNIKVGGFLYQYNSVSSTEQLMYRFLLVKARDKLHTGAQSTITATNVFRSGTGFNTIDPVDMHKVTVLFDHRGTWTPSIQQKCCKPFSFSHTFDQNMTFDADGSGYFKNGQIFFIAIVYDSRGALNWAAKFNTVINYKDA